MLSLPCFSEHKPWLNSFRITEILTKQGEGVYNVFNLVLLLFPFQPFTSSEHHPHLIKSLSKNFSQISFTHFMFLRLWRNDENLI
jgi:hypothetical protein